MKYSELLIIDLIKGPFSNRIDSLRNTENISITYEELRQIIS